MATSFARDIAPILAPYRENMMWRFDLGDYDAVKTNAEIIYGQIRLDQGEPGMPPAPLPPLSAADVAKFESWMGEGCPE